MLTPPLTLTSDDKGRGLLDVTPPPVLPSVVDGGDIIRSQTGVFSPPGPPWTSSSSLSSLSRSPPPCYTSSSTPSFSPFTSSLSSSPFLVSPPPPQAPFTPLPRIFSSPFLIPCPPCSVSPAPSLDPFPSFLSCPPSVRPPPGVSAPPCSSSAPFPSVRPPPGVSAPPCSSSAPFPSVRPSPGVSAPPCSSSAPFPSVRPPPGVSAPPCSSSAPFPSVRPPPGVSAPPCSSSAPFPSVRPSPGVSAPPCSSSAPFPSVRPPPGVSAPPCSSSAPFPSVHPSPGVSSAPCSFLSRPPFSTSPLRSFFSAPPPFTHSMFSSSPPPPPRIFGSPSIVSPASSCSRPPVSVNSFRSQPAPPLAPPPLPPHLPPTPSVSIIPSPHSTPSSLPSKVSTLSPVASSLHPSPPPSSFSAVAPPLVYSAPSPPPYQSQPSVVAPPPCCSCSSLLPRLLSAHRLEVRRLLRGALASLGRRLDSLERRSRSTMRKKRSRGGATETVHPPGLGTFPLKVPHSRTSVCPQHISTPLSSSSSSDSEDLPTPPLFTSLSQSKQRGVSKAKEEERIVKRRRSHRDREIFVTEIKEEEDSGRFVGQMAVTVGGGGEMEQRLTLHNLNHRKHRQRVGQSEKGVGLARQNGYRELHSSSSQHARHFLQSAQHGPISQSQALCVSSGQWRFSDFSPPTSQSSNPSSLHLWLSSPSPVFSFTPMLRLSAVAVETMTESERANTSIGPLRPLKDWTAPPSLGIDHCYVRTPTPSPVFLTQRLKKQRANHSSRSIILPRRRALTLPPCSAIGLSASLPVGQSAATCEFLSSNRERGKRVSQIRIRRASPRETPLTPMGLPKMKRVKKKDFSLEEIYTNKNYKSPSNNRSLETIFEEPRDKDGALFVIGQQKRRRLLLFPDFTQPRKRKKPQGMLGVGLPVTTMPRKRAAARRHCHGSTDDESDLDVMLVERLSALEDFLTRQGLEV